MPLLDIGHGQISYTAAGEGPPVLLVQGAGVVGEGWRPQIDGLRGRYTLVALDNRGIGGSSLPPGPLTIEAMAGDALALMTGLGFRRFHVIGHSMGGLIAQALALEARERVASLALLCTFAHGRQGARLTPSLLLTALRMRVGTRAMRRRAFLELVMPPAVLRRVNGRELADRLRPLFGRDLADNPRIILAQVRAMGRYDAANRLQALAGIPTLVLSAALDRIAAPSFGRELARLIPGAIYVEIPHAGHGVTIQNAADVNELLAAHLARAEHGAGRATALV